MKFEPVLQKTALMETIQQAYGHPVCALTFLPVGMVGFHYIAECIDGKRIFVTLLSDSYLAKIQTSRLDFTLELTSKLLEGGMFTAQPAIHRTLDGKLKTHFQGQPLIIYDYIDGITLGEIQPYPTEVLTNLGRLVAKLHRATANIGVDVPYIEHFRLPFEEPLLAGLKDLERISANDRPGKVELREILLPRRETIFHLLLRLHELGDAGRALNPPLVLVHTDITPNNILCTPQGDLILVDWEGIMLAPAEHDLVLFAGEGFATLLAEYYRAAAKPRLHPELFAYYCHRRNLEDITGFMVSVLTENTTAEQDRLLLDLLTSDCLSSWPFLEKSQEWAARHIQALTV